MSLNLDYFPLFKADIQSRDTALVPIVKIGSIYISTNSMSYGGQTILPLLTSNPSLKESIDIETRKYKISNVSITVNNYPYEEGMRFSDRVEGSLTNADCRVYWTSPSTTNFTNAFMIYQGNVRKYDHDDSSCKITIEDKSQATLHKDLPLANLGTGSTVPDKYKNKPIPMVYGHVDRSPCVIKSTSANDVGASEMIILTDNSTNVDFAYDHENQISNTKDWFKESLYNIPTDPLWIYKDDIYFNVFKDSREIDPSQNFTEDNYILSNNIVTITPKYNGNNPANSVGNNSLAVGLFRIPLSINLSYYDTSNSIATESSALTVTNIGNIAKHNNNYATLIANSLPEDIRFNINVKYSDVSNDELAYVRHYFLHDLWYKVSAPSGDYLNEFIFTSALFGAIPSPIIDYWWLPGDFSPYPNTQDNEMSSMTDGKSFKNNNMFSSSVLPTSDITSPLIGIKDIDILGRDDEYRLGESTAGLTSFYSNYSFEPSRVTRYSIIERGSSSVGIDIQIAGMGIYQEALLIIKDRYTFYANVNGRNMANDGGSPTAPSTIAHILENELDTIINTTLPSGYADWKYAFTVDKKINSKKLIENIASASPFIPRFDNTGEFKFTEIKKSYQFDDTSGNHKIKEADVIDFSFSRSPVEQVYTRVVFKYNWDYARGEFNDSVTSEIDGFTSLNGYQYNYYGFKMPSDGSDYDHAESELIIDDDRGKYIRDDATAQDFADWFLLWSCNQHLKMKVKLPLKYMDLEIGDVVTFDSILGGVKPYSINYIINDSVNLQNVWKVFVVTSTSKSLEFCEIECIQMHNLTGEALLGCADDGNQTWSPNPGTAACNYQQGVVHNGSCWYPSEGCTCNDAQGSMVDQCGVCGGDGPEQHYDCDGNCISGEDCAGICGGSTPVDCAGDCNGTATFDQCGNCNGECVGPNPDMPCPDEYGNFEYNCDWDCQVGSDCHGECGGTAVVDECGVCGGSGIPEGDCDCYGNVMDHCDVCGGGGADDLGCGCGEAGPSGCDNECGSTLVLDACQNCGGSCNDVPGDVNCPEECGCTPIMDGWCGCEHQYWDNCQVCGGDNSTTPEGDPCVICNVHDGSINYDGWSTAADDCLPPMTSSAYCPIPTDAGSVPYMNYVCDLLPERCEGPEDGIFNSSDTELYPSTYFLYDAIHSYCSEFPDNCLEEDQGNMNSKYPLILSQVNCQASPESGVDTVDPYQVDVVFNGFIEDIPQELQVIPIKYSAGLSEGHTGAVAQKEWSTWIFDCFGHPTGGPDCLQPETFLPFQISDISVRVHYFYATAEFQWDLQIFNDVELYMNTQSPENGLDCSAEPIWERVDSGESFPTEHAVVLETSQAVNETEFKINLKLAWENIWDWFEWYCGWLLNDDGEEVGCKTRKFKIRIVSKLGEQYDDPTTGDPQVILDFEHYFELDSDCCTYPSCVNCYHYTEGYPITTRGDVSPLATGGDGSWGTTDISVLSACILSDNCTHWNDQYDVPGLGIGCQADTNNSLGWNTSDIGVLAVCVGDGTCSTDLDYGYFPIPQPGG